MYPSIFIFRLIRCLHQCASPKKRYFNTFLVSPGNPLIAVFGFSIGGGAMASGRAQAYNGDLGLCSQRGPRAEPLDWGSGGLAPQKLNSFCRISINDVALTSWCTYVAYGLSSRKALRIRYIQYKKHQTLNYNSISDSETRSIHTTTITIIPAAGS